MQELSTLIGQAAKTAGNQGKLAGLLGVSAQRITDWKTGTRPCPLHIQAHIAELAGEDAKEWVWRDICRQLGRAAAAVLLALAASFTASDAPVVAGTQGGRRTW